MLKEQCPAPLLALFSFATPQPDASLSASSAPSGIPETSSVTRSLLVMTDVRRVITHPQHGGGDSDFEGVLDLLRVSLQLVPHRRLLPESLLQFALFRRPAHALSAASPSMLSSVGAGKGGGRVEFGSTRLTLTGGFSTVVTTMTPKVSCESIERL